MTKAYDRVKEGLSEALSIAKGDQPAASITVNGHTYVPKEELDAALKWRDAENAGLNAEYRRAEELQSELAGCKISLEQAWESNRERQEEIERLSSALSAIGAMDAEHPGDGLYSRGWMDGRWSLKKMALRAIGEMDGS